jgi:hypothetical protein
MENCKDTVRLQRQAYNVLLHLWLPSPADVAVKRYIYWQTTTRAYKREKSSPKCMYQHLSYILFIPHDFEMPLEGVKALKIFMHANAGRRQQRKGESDMTIKNSFTVLTPDP